MELIFKDLPKISLNEWYSGNHWSKRKEIKDKYYLLIKSQFKGVFRKNKRYKVGYTFKFKTKPLDASNCVAMVKMLEDIIFEDDRYDIVTELNIKSLKYSENIVCVKVEILE